MGRHFDGTAQDRVSVGDHATAEFRFGSAWSTLAFFRVENTADDDNSIIAKHGETGDFQFLCRVDAGAAPQGIETEQGGKTIFLSGDVVELNTWYLVAVTNPGDGVILTYMLEMDGTILINAGNTLTGTVNEALAEPILFGNRSVPNGADEMRGDMAWSSYFDVQFSLQDIQDYLHSPAKVVAVKNADCLYAFPLGLGSPEPDFSGRGESGTLTGTTVGDNPPIAPWYGFDTMISVPAGAAPTGRIMSSLVGAGGLAGAGGIAGSGGGLAG